MAYTVSRIAAIEANMERARRADEVKPARARRERWLKEAPVRKERNRQVQAAYRERHADDLRKAGRGATALMRLRRRRQALSWNTPPRGFMETVVEALRTFLTENEMGHCARSWRVGQGSLDGQPRYDHHLAQRGGRTRLQARSPGSPRRSV